MHKSRKYDFLFGDEWKDNFLNMPSSSRARRMSAWSLSFVKQRMHNLKGSTYFPAQKQAFTWHAVKLEVECGAAQFSIVGSWVGKSKNKWFVWQHCNTVDLLSNVLVECTYIHTHIQTYISTYVLYFCRDLAFTFGVDLTRFDDGKLSK